MGQTLAIKEFTAEDYREFSIRLDTQLQELREQIKTPSFNQKFFSLGAELEVYLIDQQGLPACLNEELLTLMEGLPVTPEVNRYNLELNFTPTDSRQGPLFAPMEREMHHLLGLLRKHAQSLGGDIVPVGILPTLGREHLGEDFMTNRDRYHALKKGLCGPDHKRYRINIKGHDHLSLEGDGISAEGANTSFQVHLRIPADEFTEYYNAAQLTAPLLLGLCANSPLVVGHRLWQESRIALFKQSVDFRDHENPEWRQPSRVFFGNGWARKEAWELFADSVSLHPPLLPILFAANHHQSPLDPPWGNHSFSELCLHHGTVWPWNRAVYGATDGGHLRIEFRTLPAGPTVVDMLANAALAVGLTLGFVDSIDHYSARLPFRYAEYNFYRAAQHGLQAKLLWPNTGQGGVRELPITDLIAEALPAARAGLNRLGTDSTEINRLWQIVEERFEHRMTGARWQLERFEHYRKHCSVKESCQRMLADYRQNIMDNQQVAAWS